MTLDDPLPHPRWVEAIRFDLQYKGASKAHARWVARYFGMLEYDYVPMPDNVLAYIGGPIIVEFAHKGELVGFEFRPPFDLLILSSLSSRSFKITKRHAPQELVSVGRASLRGLFGKILLSPLEVGLQSYEFEEPGVNDYDTSRRTVKGGAR